LVLLDVPGESYVGCVYSQLRCSWAFDVTFVVEVYYIWLDWTGSVDLLALKAFAFDVEGLYVGYGWLVVVVEPGRSSWFVHGLPHTPPPHCPTHTHGLLTAVGYTFGLVGWLQFTLPRLPHTTVWVPTTPHTIYLQAPTVPILGYTFRLRCCFRLDTQFPTPRF